VTTLLGQAFDDPRTSVGEATPRAKGLFFAIPKLLGQRAGSSVESYERSTRWPGESANPSVGFRQMEFRKMGLSGERRPLPDLQAMWR